LAKAAVAADGRVGRTEVTARLADAAYTAGRRNNVADVDRTAKQIDRRGAADASARCPRGDAAQSVAADRQIADYRGPAGLPEQGGAALRIAGCGVRGAVRADDQIAADAQLAAVEIELRRAG
jgi:hypothetical protein